MVSVGVLCTRALEYIFSPGGKKRLSSLSSQCPSERKEKLRIHVPKNAKNTKLFWKQPINVRATVWMRHWLSQEICFRSKGSNFCISRPSVTSGWRRREFIHFPTAISRRHFFSFSYIHERSYKKISPSIPVTKELFIKSELGGKGEAVKATLPCVNIRRNDNS